MFTERPKTGHLLSLYFLVNPKLIYLQIFL